MCGVEHSAAGHVQHKVLAEEAEEISVDPARADAAGSVLVLEQDQAAAVELVVDWVQAVMLQ